MATSIDWGTKVILVPRADMLLLQASPIEVRQLNVNDFRNDLNTLQADEEGMWADTTHEHSPPVTVAGVDLARVVNIINSYTVTFEDGQYAVNLTGANNNISDVNNKNQVSVNSANSAGLMDIEFMQAGAFGGQVAIDTTADFDGTTFPVGTRAYPVNNLIDAHDIADERGLDTFIVMSDLLLNAGDFSEGHKFEGINPSTVTITIADAAEVSNCEFTLVTVEGVLDNANLFRDCAILDISQVNGFIHQCALFGTVTLGGSQQAIIMDSYSGIPDGPVSGYPYIDMGGSGNSLALRGYLGELRIKNSTGTDTSSLDFASGVVIFDADCTGGEFVVRGICDVTDNSVGATITDTTINFRLNVSILDEELTAEQSAAEHITDPVLGKIILRNTDVSRRWEADAWEDADGTIPYRGRVEGDDTSGGLEKVGMLVEVAWS